MIPFNIPPYIGEEENYILEAIHNQRKLSGDGLFTKKCNEWFENNFNSLKTLLTTSCTHALEMAAILCNIKPGDEIIAPSYTFVSTVNAFVLRGAKIVFVDIHPETMNINENLIEAAITNKTKAIVPVHYAGVPCEMDKIMDIARKHNLFVIEDSAQGVMSTYKGRYLGTIGDIGCYSFHETKNYTMGEGGAISLNHINFFNHSEIIREKGTDRSKFFRGEIDKYSWVDIGSSYLPSELNAAYLYAQLKNAHIINNDRLKNYNIYYKNLKKLEEIGILQLPYIPNNCTHNAHMFYIKTKGLEERTNLISFLRKNNIHSAFHYIPLHSSSAGSKYGRFHGEDIYTTKESERLLRLPLYYGLEQEKINYISDCIYDFYNQS